MSTNYLLGVDVGTGSVRAALTTSEGRIVRVAVAPIQTWNPRQDHYEQSSDDIWMRCCQVVREVAEDINPALIKGIGFDATCSLVAIGKNDEPISVSLSGVREQNIILWMDHRAKDQADRINRLKPDVLRYVGNTISLEMETPKLLWLKENLPDTFTKVKYFFDLPDFLTWKATENASRSLCSLVCKWTYVADGKGKQGWDRTYFQQIGLEEMLQNNASIIGETVKTPGDKVGNGLSKSSASELGLTPGTPVATSVIDAHAGGLGLLGCSADGISSDFDTRLGLICGTSTCHMVVNQDPIFVPGVWGPYYSAMIPGMWLNEAGQSATGKLLDHIIETHPASPFISNKLADGERITDYLNSLLISLAKEQNSKSIGRLTSNLHIWPDFHGNRSPVADPKLRGMVSGLSLSSNDEDLALKYLATIQALAYGTKHIVDTLQSSGHNNLSSILICGGLSKNHVFVQSHADILGLPVLLPRETESVLLGAAMLAAVASDIYTSVDNAVKSMGGLAEVVQPIQHDQEYHEKKYKVFLKMLEDQRSYEKIMDS